MKVAIVTSFPVNPERPQGGVEAVSVNLVGALARGAGTEVEVVTTDPGCKSNQVHAWNGARVHRLPQGSQRLLTYARRQGRQQIRSYLLALKPDIVHAHDTYGIMVRGLEMPRVFTVHGFIYEDTRYQPGWLSWPRSLLWRWHETHSWADQSHIISINPFVRQKLRGVTRGTIHDIENPIGEDFFQVRRAERVGTVFCAAAIRRLKNTLGLVRAFEVVQQTCSSARLRLAGADSEPDYAREVRAFTSNAGISDKVSFLGPLGAAQVQEELAQASVFALVSLQENAPMGIAEAMAAGAPVVTSDRCGMPYMVRSGETGLLVEPANTEAVSRALLKLLNDDVVRHEMGRKARQVALERFHPDRVAERTMAVYRRAIQDFQGRCPAN